MLTAGLTGGMACGKSFVARAFAELGCHIIEADELGHEVMLRGGDAYKDIVEAFGPAIVHPQGEIDRALLAARVFDSPADLERLNAIIHPAVRASARRRMDALAVSDPHGIVIYVAAILIESGHYREVDKIIVVACPREQQIQRSLERPGATMAGVLSRLDRQMPLEEKRAYADYLIDTGGTKDETLRQTEVVYRDLRRLAA
jgi:dephospho-CoA kinase